MIRFIVPTRYPHIVAAEGPRFEFDLVLDTGFRMLRALADAVKERNPRARCTSGMPGEMHWPSINDSTELAIREMLYDLKKDVDIADHHCSAEAWPYQMQFSPFGSEALLYREGTYLTSDGHESKMLDGTPTLILMHSFLNEHGAPIESLDGLVAAVLGRKAPRRKKPPENDLASSVVLQEEEKAFLQHVWSPFQEEGVELVSGVISVTARFPHAAFGRGFGPVRVKVT